MLNNKKIINTKFILIALFLSLICIFLAQPVHADNQDVMDKADVLSDTTQKHIYELNIKLSKDVRGEPQIAVMTVKDTGNDSIEDYAQKMFEKYHFGHAKYDNGVLLLVSINTHKVRLQTGYGMEGIIPDVYIDELMSDKNKELLKNKDYDKAISNMTDSLYKKITSNKDSVLTVKEKKKKDEEAAKRAAARGKAALEIILLIVVILTVLGGIIILFMNISTNKKINKINNLPVMKKYKLKVVKANVPVAFDEHEEIINTFATERLSPAIQEELYNSSIQDLLYGDNYDYIFDRLTEADRNLAYMNHYLKYKDLHSNIFKWVKEYIDQQKADNKIDNILDSYNVGNITRRIIEQLPNMITTYSINSAFKNVPIQRLIDNYIATDLKKEVDKRIKSEVEDEENSVLLGSDYDTLLSHREIIDYRKQFIAGTLTTAAIAAAIKKQRKEKAKRDRLRREAEIRRHHNDNDWPNNNSSGFGGFSSGSDWGSSSSDSDFGSFGGFGGDSGGGGGTGSW